MKIDDNYFVHNSEDYKKKTIEDCLDTGENILWKGKPKKFSYIMSKCLALIPITILWILFDGFAIYMICQSTPQEEVLKFIIPFFAIHLLPVWLCIFSIVKASHEIRNTAYAITNKAIIVKNKKIVDGIVKLRFEDITGVNLHKDVVDKMLRCGDILITPKNSACVNMVQSAGQNNFTYKGKKINVETQNNVLVLSDIHDSDFIYSKLLGIVNGDVSRERKIYNTYTVCERCGSYIVNSLKKCPNCGAVNKGYNWTENNYDNTTNSNIDNNSQSNDNFFDN